MTKFTGIQAVPGLCLIAILACRPTPETVPAGSIRPDTSSQSQAHNESSPAASSDMQIKGTVHLVNVEGGCWRLDAANGSHYEIYKGSAPAGLLEDGRQVTATVKLRPDLMSICMVGPIIEVISVEG